MIAYGTLKIKSAFKLYARSQGVPADEANEVTKQIAEYETALKNADDDEEVDIYEYVDEKYRKHIEASNAYLGIIVSKSQAPCAYLIHNGDIRSEIGLMRVVSANGKRNVMCTVVDGYTADAFGYVKND